MNRLSFCYLGHSGSLPTKFPEAPKYIVANLEIDDAETIAMLIVAYGEALNENCAIIEAAAAAGDRQRAAAAAHALKGASANIGAQPFYEVARDLEKLFRGGGDEAQHLLQQLAELREQFIGEAAH